MELNPTIIQYTIKLKNIIFPLDGKSLIDELGPAGFLPAKLGQVLPNKLVVTRGDIATRGNTVLTVNPQTMLIGIAGTNGNEIISTFNELEPILSKCGVDVNQNTRFFETVGEFIIKTNSSPVKSIQGFFKSLKTMEKLGAVIGDNTTSLFTIRMVPKDVVIDSEEYYEIKIEPVIHAPNEKYYAYIVFRSATRANTENFTSNIENKLTNLLEIIEHESNT